MIIARKSQTARSGVFRRWIMREGKRKEGGTESMNRLTDRTREDAEKALEGMDNDER